jgi:hypothetical protein
MQDESNPRRTSRALVEADQLATPRCLEDFDTLSASLHAAPGGAAAATTTRRRRRSFDWDLIAEIGRMRRSIGEDRRFNHPRGQLLVADGNRSSPALRYPRNFSGNGICI